MEDFNKIRTKEELIADSVEIIPNQFYWIMTR